MKPLFLRMDEKMKNIKILNKTIKFVFCSSKKTMMAILVNTFLLGLIIPINTIVWSKFIDILIDVQSKSGIYHVLILLGLIWFLWIIQTILQKTNRYFKDMQTDYLNLSITNIVFLNLDRLEMEQFDYPEIYNKLNKINSEALGHSINIMDNMVTLLQNIVTFIATTGIILSYNPVLLIMLCVIFIPALAIDIKISSGLYEIYNGRLEKLRLVSCLKNLLLKYENIKELKIYDLTEMLVGKISMFYKKYLDEDQRIRKKNTKTLIISEIGEYIAKFIFTIYIIIDCFNTRKPVGSIVLYINTVDILMQNIGGIEFTISQMYNDLLYMETVFEYLDYVQNIEVKEKEIIKEIKSIELKNVYFKYPNATEYALENINLKIDKNTTYLIAGANGAGKTTLIKILCGLYEPTKGEMLINNKSISLFDRKSYRRKLGVVFQDFIHYPFSFEDNIKFGNYNDYDNENKMLQVIDDIGLKELITQLPNKVKTQLQNEWMDGTDISIGQWQKLAIARGLFSDADIIVMDEPTASLDSLAEDEIFQCIEKILKEKMCILISHRYSTARMVDNIIVLKNKTIYEQGTFQELIDKDGLFNKLFSLQAEKYIENGG